MSAPGNDRSRNANTWDVAARLSVQQTAHTPDLTPDAIRRRRIVQVAALAVMGLVTTAAGLWWAHLTAYLIGLGVTAFALMVLTFQVISRGRRRWRIGAASAVLAALIAAIVVPAQLATYDGRSEAEWAWSTHGGYLFASNMLHVNDRLLVQDGAGLHALDPSTGEEEWTHETNTDMGYFLAGDDGHALTLVDGASAWIDPQGQVLWNQNDIDGLDRNLSAPHPMGGGTSPVAAAGDTLVIRDCTDDGGADIEDAACVYRGIDADGEIAYEINSEGEVPFIPNQGDQVRDPHWDDSLVLPSIFLVHEPGQDQVSVVDAATGRSGGSIDAFGHSYVSDSVVVYQPESEDEDTCETRASDPDGTELWQGEAPCFTMGNFGTFTGDWIYLPKYYGEGSDQRTGTVALNATTGDLHEFGLSQEWYGYHIGSPPSTLGPEFVLESDAQGYAAVDPGSGKESWHVSASERSGAYLAGDGSALVADASAHNPFGEEDDGIVTIIDPRTGDVVFSLRLPTGFGVMPMGPRQVLIYDDDSMMLFTAD